MVLFGNWDLFELCLWISFVFLRISPLIHVHVSSNRTWGKMHSQLKFLPNNFLTYAHIMAIYEIESCTILNSLPFKVKNSKAVLTGGKYSKLLDYANLLFTTIMMSTYILRLIHIIQSKDLKTTELLWYTGWTTLIWTWFHYKLEYFMKKQETVILYNAIHDLERKYIRRGTI